MQAWMVKPSKKGSRLVKRRLAVVLAVIAAAASFGASTAPRVPGVPPPPTLGGIKDGG